MQGPCQGHHTWARCHKYMEPLRYQAAHVTIFIHTAAAFKHSSCQNFPEWDIHKAFILRFVIASATYVECRQMRNYSKRFPFMYMPLSLQKAWSCAAIVQKFCVVVQRWTFRNTYGKINHWLCHWVKCMLLRRILYLLNNLPAATREQKEIQVTFLKLVINSHRCPKSKLRALSRTPRTETPGPSRNSPKPKLT